MPRPIVDKTTNPQAAFLAKQFVTNLKLMGVKLIGSDWDGTQFAGHGCYGGDFMALFQRRAVCTEEEAKSLFADYDFFKYLLLECLSQGIIFDVVTKNKPKAIRELTSRLKVENSEQLNTHLDDMINDIYQGGWDTKFGPKIIRMKEKHEDIEFHKMFLVDDDPEEVRIAFEQGAFAFGEGDLEFCGPDNYAKYEEKPLTQFADETQANTGRFGLTRERVEHSLIFRTQERLAKMLSTRLEEDLRLDGLQNWIYEIVAANPDFFTEFTDLSRLVTNAGLAIVDQEEQWTFGGENEDGDGDGDATSIASTNDAKDNTSLASSNLSNNAAASIAGSGHDPSNNNSPPPAKSNPKQTALQERVANFIRNATYDPNAPETSADEPLANESRAIVLDFNDIAKKNWTRKSQLNDAAFLDALFKQCKTDNITCYIVRALHNEKNLETTFALFNGLALNGVDIRRDENSSFIYSDLASLLRGVEKTPGIAKSKTYLVGPAFKDRAKIIGEHASSYVGNSEELQQALPQPDQNLREQAINQEADETFEEAPNNDDVSIASAPGSLKEYLIPPPEGAPSAPPEAAAASDQLTTLTSSPPPPLQQSTAKPTAPQIKPPTKADSDAAKALVDQLKASDVTLFAINFDRLVVGQDAKLEYGEFERRKRLTGIDLNQVTFLRQVFIECELQELPYCLVSDYNKESVLRISDLVPDHKKSKFFRGIHESAFKAANAEKKPVNLCYVDSTENLAALAQSISAKEGSIVKLPYEIDSPEEEAFKATCTNFEAGKFNAEAGTALTETLAQIKKSRETKEALKTQQQELAKVMKEASSQSSSHDLRTSDLARITAILAEIKSLEKDDKKHRTINTPFAEDSLASSPLLKAIELSRADLVELLLENGANCKPDRFILYALRQDSINPAIIKLLIDNGSNVNAQEQQPPYRTALALAVEAGNLEAVNKILTHAGRTDPSMPARTHNIAFDSAVSQRFTSEPSDAIEKALMGNVKYLVSAPQKPLESAAELHASEIDTSTIPDSLQKLQEARIGAIAIDLDDYFLRRGRISSSYDINPASQNYLKTLHSECEKKGIRLYLVGDKGKLKKYPELSSLVTQKVNHLENRLVQISTAENAAGHNGTRLLYLDQDLREKSVAIQRKRKLTADGDLAIENLYLVRDEETCRALAKKPTQTKTGATLAAEIVTIGNSLQEQAERKRQRQLQGLFDRAAALHALNADPTKSIVRIIQDDSRTLYYLALDGNHSIAVTELTSRQFQVLSLDSSSGTLVETITDDETNLQLLKSKIELCELYNKLESFPVNGCGVVHNDGEGEDGKKYREVNLTSGTFRIYQDGGNLCQKCIGEIYAEVSTEKSLEFAANVRMALTNLEDQLTRTTLQDKAALIKDATDIYQIGASPETTTFFKLKTHYTGNIEIFSSETRQLLLDEELLHENSGRKTLALDEFATSFFNLSRAALLFQNTQEQANATWNSHKYNTTYPLLDCYALFSLADPSKPINKNSSKEDITKAHRTLSLKYHPDKVRNSAFYLSLPEKQQPAFLAGCPDFFNLVNKAKEILDQQEGAYHETFTTNFNEHEKRLAQFNRDKLSTPTLAQTEPNAKLKTAILPEESLAQDVEKYEAAVTLAQSQTRMLLARKNAAAKRLVAKVVETSSTTLDIDFATISRPVNVGEASQTAVDFMFLQEVAHECFVAGVDVAVTNCTGVQEITRRIDEVMAAATASATAAGGKIGYYQRGAIPQTKTIFHARPPLSAGEAEPTDMTRTLHTENLYQHFSRPPAVLAEPAPAPAAPSAAEIASYQAAAKTLFDSFSTNRLALVCNSTIDTNQTFLFAIPTLDASTKVGVKYKAHDKSYAFIKQDGNSFKEYGPEAAGDAQTLLNAAIQNAIQRKTAAQKAYKDLALPVDDAEKFKVIDIGDNAPLRLYPDGSIKKFDAAEQKFVTQYDQNHQAAVAVAMTQDQVLAEQIGKEIYGKFRQARLAGDGSEMTDPLQFNVTFSNDNNVTRTLEVSSSGSLKELSLGRFLLSSGNAAIVNQYLTQHPEILNATRIATPPIFPSIPTTISPNDAAATKLVQAVNAISNLNLPGFNHRTATFAERLHQDDIIKGDVAAGTAKPGQKPFVGVAEGIINKAREIERQKTNAVTNAEIDHLAEGEGRKDRLWYKRFADRTFGGAGNAEVNLSGIYRTAFVRCTFDVGCQFDQNDFLNFDKKYFSGCTFTKGFMDNLSKENRDALKAVLHLEASPGSTPFKSADKQQEDKFVKTPVDKTPKPIIKPLAQYRLMNGVLTAQKTPVR